MRRPARAQPHTDQHRRGPSGSTRTESQRGKVRKSCQTLPRVALLIHRHLVGRRLRSEISVLTSHYKDEVVKGRRLSMEKEELQYKLSLQCQSTPNGNVADTPVGMISVLMPVISMHECTIFFFFFCWVLSKLKLIDN